MKRFFALLILGATVWITPCLAATKSNAIELQPNKVCQIILPSKIEKIRGGFNPDFFVLDQYENILYIQCLTKFSNTNLSIITVDSSCYMIDLYYTDQAEKSAYIINEEDRIYVSTRTNAPTESDVQQTPAMDAAGQRIVTPGTTPLKYEFEEILKQKDFIIANNGVADKAMEVFIKGIYTRGNYIYFKLDITNNSELPYSYNYCGFAVVTKKKGKTSSLERIDQAPLDSYVPTNTLEYKKTTTVVYKFEKFNFSNDRILLVEMIEDNGERGLSFKISSSLLLKARKI